MSNELMLALSGEVERNDRYSSPPPLLTHAGQEDRRHEGEHVLAIRDEERKAREAVAAAAGTAVADIAWLEARTKVRTEVKYLLSRAQRESVIIADGNPELQVKFGMIDDDAYLEARTLVNRSRQETGRLFE